MKKTVNTFIKSPINYPGNKYKLLKQLYVYFPKNINNFIDLFCGGLDVSINTIAINKYANDINYHLIEIYESFQQHTIEQIFQYINTRIKEFNLTRYNAEGYLLYRNLYNTNIEYKTPLDLFTLSRFAFNNKIQFNTYNELNSSFGYNHSDFNLTQRANTKALHTALQSIKFSSLDFKTFDITQFTNKNDFIYVDPPYLISAAQYNDGPKATNSKWSEQDDLDLYSYLDKASEAGIKWAMSNVISHKGKENITLINWIEKYNVYDIYSDYSRAAYNKIQTTDPTIEVLITNYNKE